MFRGFLSWTGNCIGIFVTTVVILAGFLAIWECYGKQVLLPNSSISVTNIPGISNFFAGTSAVNTPPRLPYEENSFYVEVLGGEFRWAPFKSRDAFTGASYQPITSKAIDRFKEVVRLCKSGGNIPLPDLPAPITYFNSVNGENLLWYDQDPNTKDIVWSTLPGYYMGRLLEPATADFVLANPPDSVGTFLKEIPPAVTYDHNFMVVSGPATNGAVGNFVGSPGSGGNINIGQSYNTTIYN